ARRRASRAIPARAAGPRAPSGRLPRRGDRDFLGARAARLVEDPDDVAEDHVAVAFEDDTLDVALGDRAGEAARQVRALGLLTVDEDGLGAVDGDDDALALGRRHARFREIDLRTGLDHRRARDH